MRKDIGSKIICMHIGNFFINNGKVFTTNSHADFYNELGVYFDKVTIIGGSWPKNSDGIVFNSAKQINSKYDFKIYPGNSYQISFWRYFSNYIAFVRTILTFLFKDNGNIFIFLPSVHGTFAISLLLKFSTFSSIGVYVGGSLQVESKNEIRLGIVSKLKKNITKHNDLRLEKYLKKVSYIITSSHQLYFDKKQYLNIYLTPPMISFDFEDINKFGGNEKKFRGKLVYCGELRHAKGVRELLSAFQKLLKVSNGHNYELVIIGEGQAKSEMLDFVNYYKLNEKVSFVGQINNPVILKQYYIDSDILILPSFSEGFPRVAYEAIIHSVVPILTPVGGVPYLLKDGESAIFLEIGSVDSIVEAVLRISNDQSLRRRILEGGFNRLNSFVLPIVREHKTLASLVSKLSCKF